jgi:hypothetical protein
LSSYIVINICAHVILPLLGEPEPNLRALELRSNVGAALGKSALEVELGWHALDAVGRVDVLDQGDLVAGGAALAGDDGRVGEEELPDL